jgi:hypothetical protein
MKSSLPFLYQTFRGQMNRSRRIGLCITFVGIGLLALSLILNRVHGLPALGFVAMVGGFALATNPYEVRDELEAAECEQVASTECP